MVQALAKCLPARERDPGLFRSIANVISTNAVEAVVPRSESYFLKASAAGDHRCSGDVANHLLCCEERAKVAGNVTRRWPPGELSAVMATLGQILDGHGAGWSPERVIGT